MYKFIALFLFKSNLKKYMSIVIKGNKHSLPNSLLIYQENALVTLASH